MIDDYKAAIELTEKLKQTMPFRVCLAQQFLKMLEEKGEKVTSETWYSVDYLDYSGDEGGIFLALEPKNEQEECYVVSITHVRIDPEHELAQEVEAYRKTRIHRLRLQDSKGFASQFLANSSTRRRKRRKGFGHHKI